MELNLAPDGVAGEKAELRTRMKAFLAAVGAREREASGLKAAKAAAALPAWSEAELVLAFLSMPTELDTATETVIMDLQQLARPAAMHRLMRSRSLVARAPRATSGLAA